MNFKILLRNSRDRLYNNFRATTSAIHGTGRPDRFRRRRHRRRRRRSYIRRRLHICRLRCCLRRCSQRCRYHCRCHQSRRFPCDYHCHRRRQLYCHGR